MADERKEAYRRCTSTAFVSFDVQPGEDPAEVKQEVAAYFANKTGLARNAYVGLSDEDLPWLEDIVYEPEGGQG